MGYDPGVYVSNCYRDNLGDTVKHKHSEVIKAWADGARIEVFWNMGGVWRDCPDPNWFQDKLYRVKPETVRYRVVLLRDHCGGHWVGTVSTQMSADNTELSKLFIRWLTDWQEVEV